MTNNDKVTEVTTVTQTEVDMSIFDVPGASAENIVTPESKKPKANVFANPKTDMTFLDKDENEEEEEDEDPAGGENPPAAEDPATVVDELANIDNEEEGEDSTKNVGRPKASKDVMIATVSKLIEKGTLVPFDDDKPLEKYTEADLTELLEANFEERTRKQREELQEELYTSLPEEGQRMLEYIANGGKDLKSLFKALADTQEVRELNPDNDRDSEVITRNYLQATNFGTAEEIEEEITAWKDLGVLKKKAGQFKPKLDKMSEQVVAQKLQDQEKAKKQKEAAAQKYMDNVYNALNTKELNGIKLDPKTQGMLYTGLVQVGYPSISGKQTNLLGHLLEKYQFVEPNHGLIAETLWLLQDPEGYKAKIKEQGATASTQETVKKLKSEESRKLASSASHQEEPEKKTAKLSRPSQNFFKR